MQNLITLALGVTSGVLIFVVTNLLIKLNKYKNDKDNKECAYNNAMLCLLRVKLIEYHDEFIVKEHIPAYALENWSEMFEAYIALGGNGLVKGLNEEIKKLPIN